MNPLVQGLTHLLRPDWYIYNKEKNTHIPSNYYSIVNISPSPRTANLSMSPLKLPKYVNAPPEDQQNDKNDHKFYSIRQKCFYKFKNKK
jgi:hypothetical protein